MAFSVLIVDDVEDWRNMLAGFIHDYFPKVEVFRVASCKEAKDCIERNKIDLAVIDVRLDELDEENVEGLQLMEEIAERYTTVRTIVITGYADLDKVKRSLRPDALGQRPAVDFIEKHMVHIELLPRLRSMIEHNLSG